MKRNERTYKNTSLRDAPKGRRSNPYGIGFSVPMIRLRMDCVVVLLLAMTVLLVPHTAHAVCSAPSGAEGEVIYNSASGVPQYCDDTNWIAMVGSGTDVGPTNGLIGWWKFDETSGATAVDSAGNNIGTMQGGLDAGTDSVTGVFGNALQFNGTSDYIEIANESVFDSGPFTISLWYTTDTLTIPGHALISKYDDGPNDGYIIAQNGGGNQLMYRLDDLTDPYRILDTTTLNDTGWQHVVLVYDGATFSEVYTNGVKDDDDDTAHTGSLTNHSVPLQIGGSSSTGNYWPGSIDDVRFYNRVLSPDEIASLFNAGAKSAGLNSIKTASVIDGLVGHWRLDETSGTFVDSSGSGNDGTQSGGVEYTSSGVVGDAVGFDGSDDQITTTFTTQLSTYTVSAWAKADTTSGGVSVHKVVDRDENFNINFSHDTGGGSPLCEHRDSSNNWLNAGTTTPLNLDQWYHIACSYDGTDIYMYIDGVLIGSNTVAPPEVETDALRIGARAGGGGSLRFDGAIDDVRVYNRALSDAEILEIAQARDGIRYNFDHRAPEFFDGNRWVSMAPSWGDVSSNLVAHYKFDETTGTTAYDEVGSNDLSLTSLDFSTDSVPGATGTALEYNGDSEYVSVANDPAFNFNVPFTLSIWINPHTFGAGTDEDRLVMKGPGAQNTSKFVMDLIDGKPAFANYFATTGSTCDNGTTTCVFSDTVLTAGQWYHLVAMHDGTTGKLYINGVEDETNDFAWDGTANTDDLVIGGRTTNSDMFDGVIDDFRLYDEILTDAEITALYNMGPHTWSSTDTPAGCSAIGDVCDDGGIYAGLSPDGNVAMFAAPADYTPGTYYWNAGNGTGTWTSTTSTACTQNGPGSVITTCVEGAANTAAIVGTDADGGTAGMQTHEAAQACYDLVIGGADDWYLPAQEELWILYNNRAAIGGFTDDMYWSSSEDADYDVRRINFTNGAPNYSNKDSAFRVRCVRKGPAPRCASPYGRAGQMIYNGDSNVLQYCDGARWTAIGKVQ